MKRRVAASTVNKPVHSMIVLALFSCTLSGLAGCRDVTRERIAAARSQCWSFDRLRIRIGDLTFDLPSVDRYTGDVLVEPLRYQDMVDIPSQLQAPLLSCQKKTAVPLDVRSAVMKWERGALYPGSPEFNRIELIAVDNQAPPWNVDFDLMKPRTIQHLAFVADEHASGPVRDRRLRYHATGTVPLSMECQASLSEHEQPADRWSNCQVLGHYRKLRLWLQFYPDSGLAREQAPRAIAAAVGLLKETVANGDAL